MVASISSVIQRHIRCLVVEKYLYEKVLHIPRDFNQCFDIGLPVTQKPIVKNVMFTFQSFEQFL